MARPRERHHGSPPPDVVRVLPDKEAPAAQPVPLTAAIPAPSGGGRCLTARPPRDSTDLRMADFAHLCAQLDTATGLCALGVYWASLDDLNHDVTEGDLLAQTVLKHAAGLDGRG